MRVTGGMLIQQLSQALKAGAGQNPAVGAVITARITSVLDGTVLLETGNGKQLPAKDASSAQLQVGQTVNFEVLGYDDDGMVQIRPLFGEPEALQPEDSDQLTKIMKGISMNDTDANRQLLKALLSYRVPLNATNVKQAQEMAVNAKAILQLTDSHEGQSISKLPEDTLKQIAIKLIENSLPKAPVQVAISQSSIPEGDDGKPQGPPEEPSVLSRGGGKLQELHNGAQGNAVSSAPSVTLPEKQMLSSVDVNGAKVGKDAQIISETGLEADEAVSDTSDVIKAPEILSKEPVVTKTDSKIGVQALRDIISQLSPEKIGFMVKNQLPGNIGTVETIGKVIEGKKAIGEQLQNLLDMLPDDDGTAGVKSAVKSVLNAVRLSQTTDPFELSQEIKNASKAMSELSKGLNAPQSGDARLREAVSEVKSSIDLLARLSESATYLHVPVNMGQGSKPMDLYVQRDRSGQKKVNPNDTRIFISLETNNIDVVQCLVEIKDRRLNVGIKVADEGILEHIEPYLDPLKHALTELGYLDIHLHSSVFTKPLNLMDVTAEPALEGQFDLRI